MTSRKSIVFVLLLLGVLSAFNIHDYLYVTERNVSVTYTNFTSNGTQYSIVKIGGVETFLLQDGTPADSQAAIESAVYAYYVNTYYPTQSELQGLRDMIKKFNDSRNDGYDFKGKEEYVCRNDVLLSNGKVSVAGKPIRCTDDASCQQVAMLLFSVYGEGLALGSPSAILAPLKEFTPYSIAMDDILSNYTYKLDNLDPSNVGDTIAYIRENTPTLVNYSLKIENTIFRLPRLNDSADRTACTRVCWAICPSFDLDQGALEALQSDADALAVKVAPIHDFSGIASRIYDNTLTRFAFAENESLAARYIANFDALNDSGAASIRLGQEAVSRVSNSTLSTDLNRLVSLHASIPDDIEDREFGTTESDLLEYDRLTKSVRNLSIAVLEEYNATLEIKNTAESTLLALDSKDLGPASQASFEALKARMDLLDAGFRNGLTIGQLRSVRSNYTEITAESQRLLTTETDLPATRAVSLFRGLARRLNSGFFSLAESTGAMAPADVPANPLSTFGVFSALVFLSFSSVMVLLLLFVLVSYKFSIAGSRRILGSAVLCSVIVMMGVSVMLYLFLMKTSGNATLGEFLSDFDSRNSTAIVVNLGNVSYADSQSMSSCARSLADSVSLRNKTWTLYTLASTTCARLGSSGAAANESVSSCEDEIAAQNSSFVLGYSSVTQPPRFSTIYVNRAEIEADSQYYSTCPLVALFG